MKREHTPGPWRIGDAGNTVFGPKTDRPSPQTIATLSVIDHEANGRLIAAAPELLAVAKFQQAYDEGEPWAVEDADRMLTDNEGRVVGGTLLTQEDTAKVLKTGPWAEKEAK